MDISSLLRRAKQLGDYLIVALSTDEFNWKKNIKNVISPTRNVNSFWRPYAMWIW